MKRFVCSLGCALILLGAGCSAPKSASVDPCSTLSREELVTVAQIDVTLLEPEVFQNGTSRCTYFTGERVSILQLTHDTVSVPLFVSQLRNAFPTNNQPSVDDRAMMGLPSALVTLPSGGSMLYVMTGTGGILLSNVGNQTITSEMLILLMTKLIQ